MEGLGYFLVFLSFPERRAAEKGKRYSRSSLTSVRTFFLHFKSHLYFEVTWSNPLKQSGIFGIDLFMSGDLINRIYKENCHKWKNISKSVFRNGYNTLILRVRLCFCSIFYELPFFSWINAELFYALWGLRMLTQIECCITADH